MAKIITSIECRTERFPNEIRTSSGERKVFDFGTPPSEWPKWNPAFDSLVRGRPNQYVVRITEVDKSWRETTRELVSETPPPAHNVDVDAYVKSLESWPHFESQH